MHAFKTKRVPLGDGFYAELTSVPPRHGFRALAEFTAMVGPAVAGLITGAGVRVSDEVVVPWATIVSTPTAAVEVLNGALRQLGALQGDRLLLLVDSLIVGHCTLTVPGGRDAVAVTSVDVLDAFLPDPWALVGLARAAIALNLFPTSAGGGGAPTSPARPAEG